MGRRPNSKASKKRLAKLGVSKEELQLIKACSIGDLGTAMQLVREKGVNVNCHINPDTTTVYSRKGRDFPLMAAVDGRHTEIVMFLVSRPELDPNHRQTPKTESALERAVMGHHDPVITQLLLSNPLIDPNAFREGGDPPLLGCMHAPTNKLKCELLESFIRSGKYLDFHQTGSTHRRGVMVEINAIEDAPEAKEQLIRLWNGYHDCSLRTQKEN